MNDKTDWNLFYQQRGDLSRITLKFTFLSFFLRLSSFLSVSEPSVCAVPLTLIEFGSGNSVFYDDLVCAFPKSRLTLIDLCEITSVFSAHISSNPLVHNINANLLVPETQSLLATLCKLSDVIFSSELIEHFKVPGTREFIAKHFAATRPEELVYLSFPPNAWLYRLVRRGFELCKCWPFHDEHLLNFEEVRAAASEHGTELVHGVCHRLGLVQSHVLYRKHGAVQ